MFEVLKLFIQSLFDVLDLKGLRTRQADSKIAQVGAELFLLYSALNSVYVAGIQIVDRIDGAIERSVSGDAVSREGSAIFVYGNGLHTALSYQFEKIREVDRLYRDLAHVIDIVDGGAASRIDLFLNDKMNIIQFLLGQLGKYSLDDDEQDSLLFSASVEDEIIQRLFGRWPVTETPSQPWWLTPRRRWIYNLYQRDDSERIESYHKIPLAKIDVLRQYVIERKPRDQLRELRALLDDFHDSLASTFSIRDVLLEVGDPRAGR